MMLSSRNRYAQNNERRREKYNQHPKKYYSSEDEDEEEEERLLSEQFGEATETNNVSKKRKTNENKEDDKDLEKDFANAAVKKPRILRPKFESSHLIGPKGLIQMKNDMPGVLERHTFKLASRKQKQYKKSSFQYQSEASFGKALTSTYKQFCHNLFPHLAFEDILLRIEKFGSKKEVKDYVQSMREDTRRFNLEKLYGMEKADRILKNFDDFRNMDGNIFQDHVEMEEGNEPYDEVVRENASRDEKKKTIPKKNYLDLDEGETEAIFEDETIPLDNNGEIDENSKIVDNEEANENKNDDISEMDDIVQDSEYVSDKTNENHSNNKNIEKSKLIALHNISTDRVNNVEEDVTNKSIEDPNPPETKKTINDKSDIIENANQETNSMKSINRTESEEKDESGDTSLGSSKSFVDGEKVRKESRHLEVQEYNLLKDVEKKQCTNNKDDDENDTQNEIFKETTMIEQQDSSEDLVLDFSQIPSQEDGDNHDESKVENTDETFEKDMLDETKKSNDGNSNYLAESEEIVIDSSQISIQE